MKVYAVGGAVRDELLGLPVTDRDYVVVGATPEEMIALGYKPVGRDFPVFLHPATKEEYALARTERKTARGYHGFEFHAAPDVTLEQDLARRDLTINAMARDGDGQLVDPFDGAADLKAGVLRHVGPAFAEDPVRILRVARFAARFGFAVAPATLAQMRIIVEQGEADALVAERVWQEVSRGLMEKMPSRMFNVLGECGALAVILPELEPVVSQTSGGNALVTLDRAADAAAPLTVRFALLAMTAGKRAIESLCERLRVPQDCRELALLAAEHCATVCQAANLTAASLLQLLQATDALRRPERFEELLAVCRLATGNGADGARLRDALAAARAVDAGAIARRAGTADAIKRELTAARVKAIQTISANKPVSAQRTKKKEQQ